MSLNKKATMYVMSDLILSEIASPRISNYINAKTELQVLLLYKRVVSDMITRRNVGLYTTDDILESIKRNVPDGSSIASLLFVGNIIYAVRTTLDAEILKGTFKQNAQSTESGSYESEDDKLMVESLLYHYKLGHKMYEA